MSDGLEINAKGKYGGLASGLGATVNKNASGATEKASKGVDVAKAKTLDADMAKVLNDFNLGTKANKGDYFPDPATVSKTFVGNFPASQIIAKDSGKFVDAKIVESPNKYKFIQVETPDGSKAYISTTLDKDNVAWVVKADGKQVPYDEFIKEVDKANRELANTNFKSIANGMKYLDDKGISTLREQLYHLEKKDRDNVLKKLGIKSSKEGEFPSNEDFRKALSVKKTEDIINDIEKAGDGILSKIGAAGKRWAVGTLKKAGVLGAGGGIMLGVLWFSNPELFEQLFNFLKGNFKWAGELFKSVKNMFNKYSDKDPNRHWTLKGYDENGKPYNIGSVVVDVGYGRSVYIQGANESGYLDTDVDDTKLRYFKYSKELNLSEKEDREKLVNEFKLKSDDDTMEIVVEEDGFYYKDKSGNKHLISKKELTSGNVEINNKNYHLEVVFDNEAKKALAEQNRRQYDDSNFDMEEIKAYNDKLDTLLAEAKKNNGYLPYNKLIEVTGTPLSIVSSNDTWSRNEKEQEALRVTEIALNNANLLNAEKYVADKEKADDSIAIADIHILEQSSGLLASKNTIILDKPEEKLVKKADEIANDEALEKIRTMLGFNSELDDKRIRNISSDFDGLADEKKAGAYNSVYELFKDKEPNRADFITLSKENIAGAIHEFVEDTYYDRSGANANKVRDFITKKELDVFAKSSSEVSRHLYSSIEGVKANNPTLWEKKELSQDEKNILIKDLAMKLDNSTSLKNSSSYSVNLAKELIENKDKLKEEGVISNYANSIVLPSFLISQNRLNNPKTTYEKEIEKRLNDYIKNKNSYEDFNEFMDSKKGTELYDLINKYAKSINPKNPNEIITKLLENLFAIDTGMQGIANSVDTRLAQLKDEELKREQEFKELSKTINDKSKDPTYYLKAKQSDNSYEVSQTPQAKNNGLVININNFLKTMKEGVRDGSIDSNNINNKLNEFFDYLETNDDFNLLDNKLQNNIKDNIKSNINTDIEEFNKDKKASEEWASVNDYDNKDLDTKLAELVIASINDPYKMLQTQDQGLSDYKSLFEKAQANATIKVAPVAFGTNGLDDAKEHWDKSNQRESLA